MLTTEEKKTRRRSLGASEIAAVCGLDPFRGIWDVWASKVGLGIEEDVPSAEMGHLFERPLLEHYSQKTGIALTYPKNMRHPKYDWVSATPDGIKEKDRVVQAKMVGGHMAHHWGTETAAEYVVIQVQWEMMVADVPLAVIVACIGGTDYRTYDVPADAQMQEDLLDIGRSFWYEHVLPNVPPDPDASEACRRAVAARYRKVSSDMLPASRELIEMAREHKALGKQIGGLEKQRETIGNALRLAIGERSGFEWDTGRCTWAPDKNGNRTLRVSVKGERE